MIFLWGCFIMPEILNMIGCTISVKTIITKTCVQVFCKILPVCCLQCFYKYWLEFVLFFFQIKICGNRQPLVRFILSFHYYSITLFNKLDRNCVDRQIYYHFYHKFAELLLKFCQFFHLGRFASMICSFATRLGWFTK